MGDAKRRRFLATRAAKLARQRRKRKRVTRNAWRHLTRDQQEVAKRLSKGQISLVTLSGWSFLASFLAFLDEISFYALLDIEGMWFKPVMIPIARLVMTYKLKILLGIPSVNLVPTKLFREVALLKLIGYTETQVRAGFCERGNLGSGPMHKNTLADAMERLSAAELDDLLNKTASRLAQRGLFKKSKGHFALDATDLETTARYKCAGMKKYTERKLTKDKQVVEVERYAYGFKVLIVYEVHLRLVVAAKVAPIQKHESQFTLTLVRQAVQNVGRGVLRVLLIDRGFLDGQDLWVLKQEMGIDFVVPAKEDGWITADAQGLSRGEADGEYVIKQEHAGKQRVVKKGKKTEVRWEGQVSLVGVAELRSYDQYGDAEHIKHANSKGFKGNALNKVIVFAGSYYAIFDIEEFVILLGVVPRVCLRADPAKVRRRYGLPSAA